MTDSATYIRDQVRTHDRDRFITALFAPNHYRDRLFTLYAFNSEIARIRETVSEPLIGQMRLQWWRDMLNRLDDGVAPPKGHPIAEALGELVGQCSLPIATLIAMVDAREGDLEESPIELMSDLLDYARQTSGNLSSLALHCVNAKDESTVSAATSVGLAWALTGVVRSVARNAHAGRVMLPGALLAQAGLTIHDLQSSDPSRRLAPILEAVSVEAEKHLVDARRLANQIDLQALPVLLPATLASQYLTNFRRVDFNPYHPRFVAQRPNVLRLCWRAWRHRY